jgi:hypothetical protein
VTATAAPGTAEPDLSTTLPEKLPVAWPCAAGETMREITQTIARSNVLWNLVSAGPLTDPQHFNIVLFIVKPLSNMRLRR